MTEASARIGRYEVVRTIARGGMGTVYLVVGRAAGGFERRFALKACHPHLVDEAEFVSRFLDEGRIAARVHHPNVVATLDVVHEGAALYLLMEYVDGVSLHVLTKRAFAGERLAFGLYVKIAIDALSGLDAVHKLTDERGVALGVTHRDVSPQNILVGRDGLARITDFGIARARDSSVQTREGEIRGKFGYMAPEQVTGAPVDARTDVYAMGVVLWEILAGRSFRSSVPVEAIQSILSGQPTAAPSSFRDDVPAPLEAVVLRALSRDPRDRHATASAFALDLAAAMTPASAADIARAIEALGEPVASTAEPQATATTFESDLPPGLPAERGGAITSQDEPARSTVPITEMPLVAPHARRTRRVIAASAGVVVTIVVAVALRHRSGETVAEPTAVRASSAITTTAAPALESASTEPQRVVIATSATASVTIPARSIEHRAPHASVASSSKAWRPSGP